MHYWRSLLTHHLEGLLTDTKINSLKIEERSTRHISSKTEYYVHIKHISHSQPAFMQSPLKRRVVPIDEIPCF